MGRVRAVTYNGVVRQKRAQALKAIGVNRRRVYGPVQRAKATLRRTAS